MSALGAAPVKIVALIYNQSCMNGSAMWVWSIMLGRYYNLVYQLLWTSYCRQHYHTVMTTILTMQWVACVVHADCLTSLSTQWSGSRLGHHVYAILTTIPWCVLGHPRWLYCLKFVCVWGGGGEEGGGGWSWTAGLCWFLRICGSVQLHISFCIQRLQLQAISKHFW